MKLKELLKVISGEVSILDESLGKIVYQGVASKYNGVCDYCIINIMDGDRRILINVY